MKGERSAGDAALVEGLAMALALEIRAMMDEGGGQFQLGGWSGHGILEMKRTSIIWVECLALRGRSLSK